MIKISGNTRQPDVDDRKSTIREKIFKFFHTKILGIGPEFYEVIRSLGNGQDDEHYSSEGTIIYGIDEDLEENEGVEL